MVSAITLFRRKIRQPTNLSSESDSQAFRDYEKLQKTVEQIVRQNEHLVERMRKLEAGIDYQARSLKATEGDSVRTVKENKKSISDIDADSIASNESDVREGQTAPPWTNQHDFEAELEASRVYKRVDMNETDMLSIRPSTIQSEWSVLSSFSLNDISVVAVFRIPITLNDIKKIGTDLTFSMLLSRQAFEVIRQFGPQNRAAGRARLLR
jgi:hypothetical protein